MSIVRNNFTTLDVIVKNADDMLCLLHVLHVKVKPTKLAFDSMIMYKLRKLRMKIAYEAWGRKITVSTLFLYAVNKTLQQ